MQRKTHHYPLLFLLILLLLITNITLVNADKKTYTYYTENHPQTANIVHPDKNYLCEAYKSGTSIYVRITSIEGQLIGTVQAITSVTYNTYASITYWDDDEIVVITAPYYTGSGTDYISRCAKVNLTSLTSTQYTSNTYDSSSSTLTYRISQLWKANNNIYALAFGYSATNPDRIVSLKFTGTTLTISAITSLTLTTLNIYSFGFLQGDYVYLIYTYGGTTPRFAILDTTSTTLTDLAVSGYSDWSTEYYIHYVNGFTQYIGDYVYLTHVWVKPQVVSNVRSVCLYAHRLIFNGSIHPNNLITQQRFATAITLNYPASSTPVWCLTAVHNNTAYQMYYLDYVEGVDTKKVATITLENWDSEEYDTASLNVRNIKNLIGLVEYTSATEILHWLTYPTNTTLSNFAVGVINTDKHVYYGLTTPSIVFGWDVTLTHYPTAEPLYTGTTYNFTGKVTYDGSGTQTIVKVLANGHTWKTTTTDTRGYFTFNWAIIGYTGEYNFTIIVYDMNMIEQYQKTFYYIVIAYTPPPSYLPPQDVLIPQTSLLLTTILPLLIIILAPAFAFGTVLKSTMGYIIGFFIGVGIGYMVNLIPFPVFMLFVLLAVAFIVQKIRSSG